MSVTAKQKKQLKVAEASAAYLVESQQARHSGESRNPVRLARLAEVAEINPRRFSNQPDDAELVSFIPMKAVEKETGRLDASEMRPWRDVKKGYTPFQDGDVIFAKITPCMENGKFALAKDLHDGRAAGSTEFHVFRPGLKLDADYLLHFLFTPELRSNAKRKMQGAAGQLRVTSNFFDDVEIPLPSLNEQRLIVAEIEKQFTRLDAGIAALRRVQANLKRYRAAVLKAACEGRLVSTQARWPTKAIDIAIASLDQGWSPKCDREPSENQETWAVIKTTAIQPLRYLEAENKRLPTTLEPRLHLELIPGDLLVTRAGPRSRVGVACAVKSTRPRLMLCDKAYRVRCKRDVASPAFLELVLNAPHIVEALEKLKTGISDSGLNLTQDRFRELQIPLPPLAEQERVVAEVERRLSVVEEQEAVVTADLQRASRLRQAVLQCAFSP